MWGTFEDEMSRSQKLWTRREMNRTGFGLMRV